MAAASAYFDALSRPWPSTVTLTMNSDAPAAADGPDTHPSLPPVSPMSPLLPEAPTMLMAPSTPPRNGARTQAAYAVYTPDSHGSAVQPPSAMGSPTTDTKQSSPIKANPLGNDGAPQPPPPMPSSSLQFDSSPSAFSTPPSRLRNLREQNSHRRPSRLSFRSGAFRHPSQASSHTGFAVNPTPPASAPPLTTSSPLPGSPASTSTKLASRTKNLFRKLSMPLRKLGKKQSSKAPAASDANLPSRGRHDTLGYSSSMATLGHMESRSRTLSQLGAIPAEDGAGSSRSASSASLSPAMLSTVPHPNPQLRSTQSAGHLLVSHASLSANAQQTLPPKVDEGPSPTRSQHLLAEQAYGSGSDQQPSTSRRLSSNIGESSDTKSTAADAGSIDSARAYSQLRLSASPPPGMVVGLESMPSSATHEKQQQQAFASQRKQALNLEDEEPQRSGPFSPAMHTSTPEYEAKQLGAPPSPHKQASASVERQQQRECSPQRKQRGSPATSPRGKTSSPGRHQSSPRVLDSHGPTSGHSARPPPPPAPSTPLPPLPTRTYQLTSPRRGGHVDYHRRLDSDADTGTTPARSPSSAFNEGEDSDGSRGTHKEGYQGQSRLSRDWSALSDLGHNDSGWPRVSSTRDSSHSSDLSTAGPFAFDNISLIPSSRPSSGIEPTTGGIRGSPPLHSQDVRDRFTKQASRPRQLARNINEQREHDLGQIPVQAMRPSNLSPAPSQSLFASAPAVSSSVSAPQLASLAGSNDPIAPPPTFTAAQVRAFGRLLPEPPTRAEETGAAIPPQSAPGPALSVRPLRLNVKDNQATAANKDHHFDQTGQNSDLASRWTESNLTLIDSNHSDNNEDSQGTANAREPVNNSGGGMAAALHPTLRAGQLPQMTPLPASALAMDQTAHERASVQIPGSYPLHADDSAAPGAPGQEEQSRRRDAGPTQPLGSKTDPSAIPPQWLSSSISRNGPETQPLALCARCSGESPPPSLPPRTSSRLAVADLELVRDVESARDAASGPGPVPRQGNVIDVSASAGSSAATLVGGATTGPGPSNSSREYGQMPVGTDEQRIVVAHRNLQASSNATVRGHVVPSDAGTGMQVDLNGSKNQAYLQDANSGTAPAARDALRSTTLL